MPVLPGIICNYESRGPEEAGELAGLSERGPAEARRITTWTDTLSKIEDSTGPGVDICVSVATERCDRRRKDGLETEQILTNIPHELRRGERTVDHVMERCRHHSRRTRQSPSFAHLRNSRKFTGYSALGQVCKVTPISHRPLTSNSHISRSTITTSQSPQGSPSRRLMAEPSVGQTARRPFSATAASTSGSPLMKIHSTSGGRSSESS